MSKTLAQGGTTFTMTLLTFTKAKPMPETTLILDRKIFTDQSTIGELLKGNDLICYVLEDTCRTHKVHGKTAIPSGSYEVVITHSARFGIELPLLLNVPGFEGVRIHPGNSDVDTEGCLLPGLRKGENIVYDSKKAMSVVMDHVWGALRRGRLFLAVYGGPDSHKEVA